MSDAPLDVLGMTSDRFVGEAARRLEVGAGLARALYRQAMLEGRFDPEAAGAGRANAAAWRDLVQLTLPEVVGQHADGDTRKVALARGDERPAYECVHVPMGARGSSLCLSTQAGCRMACRFCETGRMGLVRGLGAAEIVAQVVVARTRLGHDPRTLVFMGMGEPLDNTDALIAALRVLTDPVGLAFGRDRITVCTVGRVAGIARLRALGWKRLGLALSLNAPDDDLRRQIMPVAANEETLADLQRALVAFRQRKNLELGIHYCLLPGINDGRAEARGVARFCAPLGRATVHLIPYNPGSVPLTRAPEPGEVERFVGWLRAEGVAVRRRLTKGRGAFAACGQLGDAAWRRGARRDRDQASAASSGGG